MRLRSVSMACLLLGLFPVAAACNSGDDAMGGATDPTTPPPGGAVVDPPKPGQPEPGQTDIVFGPSATFQKRDCALTVRYEGAGTTVQIAGEFTGWAASPLPMTKKGNAFEVTLQPGPQLQAGALAAYKLVVDGQWILDPGGKYRKIVGGIMNSGLKLPTCEAGPELQAGGLTASAGGDARVRIHAGAAADGTNVTRLSASLDGAKVPAGSFKIDDSTGEVDFTFAGLPKGKHTLRLGGVDAKDRKAEEIELPFWIEDEAFDYRDGILYMFMIDRFANGDKANDKPVGAPVQYDADWHGGDLDGARKVLETGYFEKLGVRTIWISPVNQQTDNKEIGDGNQWFSAYHGYWPTRARTVEPRFGGDAALKSFVAEAHKRGIRVIVDLINNQVHKDHEYVANTSSASWFRNSCKCGDDAIGCGWSQRPFDCMFQPYLPDINWNEAGAEKQFIADAVHWISAYDFDGFRVDAVKHVEANSVYNMRAELTRRYEQGGARIFMVGETAVGEGDRGNFFGEQFDNGYAWIDAYTGKTALDGQFDFPTRHNMADGLVNGGKPLNEVEGELRKAETKYRPGYHHVRFLNGHDNPRIASIAAGDPKLGCSWASGCRGEQLPPLNYGDAQVYVKLKRALTVLYTLPGVPYLYSGDEVAFAGGADPDMRRNMLFAEQELAGLQMTASGPAPALTSQQVALRDWARKLGATRAASKALRRGDRVVLLGNEADLWVYAYQTAPNEVAIVAINRGGAVSRTLGAGSLQLGSVNQWTSALGTGSLTPSGSQLQISLGAGEAAIFVAK